MDVIRGEEDVYLEAVGLEWRVAGEVPEEYWERKYNAGQRTWGTISVRQRNNPRKWPRLSCKADRDAYWRGYSRLFPRTAVNAYPRAW